MLSLITTWTRRSWTAQSVMMLRKIIVIRSAERPRVGTVGGRSGQTATRRGIQLSQRIAIHRASEIVSRAATVPGDEEEDRGDAAAGNGHHLSLGCWLMRRIVISRMGGKRAGIRSR